MKIQMIKRKLIAAVIAVCLLATCVVIGLSAINFKPYSAQTTEQGNESITTF